RRLFVLLVLEQAADELLPRIADFVLVGVGLRRIRRGQKLARFDVRQRRRHEQILTGNVEIQRAHLIEVRNVLLGDERDGNVEDVELVLPDQMQQEIERPLEDFELDVVVAQIGSPQRSYHCLIRWYTGPMMWSIARVNTNASRM